MRRRSFADPRRGSLLALAVVAAAFGMGGSFPHGQPSDHAPVATAPIRSPTGSIASSSTTPPDRQAISGGPGTGRAHVRGVAVANGRLRLQPGALIGSWSIAYHSGPENGHSANIDLPLRRLDGLVIRAGGVFDFWRAVGEVSSRAGYRRGGIIVGDHVDPGGALAGGICAVSTALFNAAARAGLQIRSRHAHSGYLARYPLGLDAAVASGSGSTQTLAFRNDTDQPIQIRTLSLPGLARVDLYAARSLGRTVELSTPRFSQRTRARDRLVPASSLRLGERRRVADASDGMRVLVTRTVRDADGRILHRDRWVSNYRPLAGLVRYGSG